jgi:multicomponent Na+:H+ antiporter subunit A
MYLGLDLLLVIFVILLFLNWINRIYIYLLVFLLYSLLLLLSLNKNIEVNYYTSEFFGINYSLKVLYKQIILLIRSIGILVIIYSIYYLSLNLNTVLNIFIVLFLIFMNNLLLSNNLIGIIISYECIGIISYYLINYYIYRLENIKSSMNSLIIGKLGDLLLLIGLLLSSYINILNKKEVIYIYIILLFSSIIKSCQIPLHN